MPRVSAMSDHGSTRRYVDVVCLMPHNVTRPVPLEIVWSDERRIKVDDVIEVRFVEGISLDEPGYRYKVKLGRHVRFLYYDMRRWYVMV